MLVEAGTSGSGGPAVTRGSRVLGGSAHGPLSMWSLIAAGGGLMLGILISSGSREILYTTALVPLFLIAGARGVSISRRRLGRSSRPLLALIAEHNHLRPSLFESVLFFALASGPPRLRARDPLASLSGQVDWAVLLNLGIWGSGLAWVVVRVLDRTWHTRSRKSLTAVGFLTGALIVLLALSVVVSPARLLSGYRVAQILITVLFAREWITRFGVHRTLTHLKACLGILLVAIGAAALLAPDLVMVRGRLRGDLIADSGSVAVLMLVLALAYDRSGAPGDREGLPSAGGLADRDSVQKNPWSVHGVLILLAALLLVLSRGRTAMATLAVVTLLALIRNPRNRGINTLAYLAILGLFMAGILGLGVQLTDFVIRERSTVMTLNQRTLLWQYTINETVRRSPWTGAGFYANRATTLAFNPRFGTSHSAYVEILSGGGYPSLAAFLALLITLGKRATTLLVLWGRSPAVFTTVCLFVIPVVIGLTTEAAILNGPLAFTMWMSVTLIPYVQSVCRAHEAQEIVRARP